MGVSFCDSLWVAEGAEGCVEKLDGWVLYRMKAFSILTISEMKIENYELVKWMTEKNQRLLTGVYIIESFLILLPPPFDFLPRNVSRFKIYDFLPQKAIKQCN